MNNAVTARQEFWVDVYTRRIVIGETASKAKEAADAALAAYDAQFSGKAPVEKQP